MSLFNPIPFQGNLKKSTNYFEGWYFKQVTKDGSEAFAVIPGVALNGNDSHSFIQIVDGYQQKSHYYRFPLSSFKNKSKYKFSISIAENQFSLSGFELSLPEYETEEGFNHEIKGKIELEELTPYRGFWPGIMGPFSFIPQMECFHGLGSMNHFVNGQISCGENTYQFNKGKGYIEKDWGRSFPETYIWLQANNFDDSKVSLMLSFAKIPWLGQSFPGFLGFIKLPESHFYVSTYNNSQIISLKENDSELTVHLQKGNFDIQLIARKEKGKTLKAPQLGNMEWEIKESVKSEMSLLVKNRKTNQLIFQGESSAGGLEIMEGATDLFNKPNGLQIANN